MLFESASVKDGAIKAFLSLFPAHAGVIPQQFQKTCRHLPFPRARGGDPYSNGFEGVVYLFSPRTRG